MISTEYYIRLMSTLVYRLRKAFN